jgi:hypothetical protein
MKEQVVHFVLFFLLQHNRYSLLKVTHLFKVIYTKFKKDAFCKLLLQIVKVANKEKKQISVT